MATSIVAKNNRCPKSRDTSDEDSDSGREEIVYQIALESTDSDTDCEATESICSIQAESTARDSSDISTEYSSEFELASTPERWQHPWSFTRDNSSSENSPQQVNVVDVKQVDTESDTCDISSNVTDHDSDECGQVLKFTRCAMCSKINENSSFQFCTSCYKIKKGFFPEKPRARKRKQPTEDRTTVSKKLPRLENDESEELSPTTMEDNGSANCNSAWNSPNHLSENQVTDGDSPDLLSPPITDGACASATDSGFETNNSQDWVTETPQEPEKCLACLNSSTNALFLHGKTGHQCCCYQCAKRIWFETRRCPICRSKVSNIIRILNS